MDNLPTCPSAQLWTTLPNATDTYRTHRVPVLFCSCSASHVAIVARVTSRSPQGLGQL
ncbi:hypothetical protein HMPREF9621_00514 [Cutibacterium modestum HL037PA2]|nr:hypothetical protein HMPREF9621_00514 [Cutibacterium modestum HL037PA2]